ncbi:hypothetical protein [Chryseobacterium sp. PMSZPI]|uniref:hypothetical protein n=1 Tax=Chryseobacterium sp. PMSZPI TaxID=1033900 RepID=UPI000C325252|nr:hypothetical protein [Chryseobacterium sp. PMSZPI]PKF76137.1 hypothetical protein CW752_00685 [Chryseobacterium sp. PMSZPI]
MDIYFEGRLSQKSNNLAFVIDYVESSISDEGRISLTTNYMRFFTAFLNYVRKLSVYVQNDTFETASPIDKVVDVKLILMITY